MKSTQTSGSGARAVGIVCGPTAPRVEKDIIAIRSRAERGVRPKALGGENRSIGGNNIIVVNVPGLDIEHLHGPEEITYAENELVVVCLVRDGQPWIKSFVEHYFALGVKLGTMP